MKAKFEPRIRLENRPKLEKLIPLNVPFIINVDPSDVCNFRCKFCPTADRALMKKTPNRNFGLMDWDLYRKIVDDICKFRHPIKVLRLYKDGEPLLHPRFPEMVAYAKEMGCAESIDTTVNGSRLSPELNLRIIDAGLDRINISVYGMSASQFLDFSKAKIDFESFVANIRHFYEHRGSCKMLVKINGDTITKEDCQRFLEIFGEIADGVYIEHIMSCWPEFDLETRGVKVNEELGIYGQPIKEVQVCPYIFYSFSINSDGSASACFLDWERKLLIGNVKDQSVKEVWSGIQLLAHQNMMLMKQRKQHPVCGNCGQLTHGMPDDIDIYAEELLERINTR